jgi:hypothetical protein
MTLRSSMACRSALLVAAVTLMVFAPTSCKKFGLGGASAGDGGAKGDDDSLAGAFSEGGVVERSADEVTQMGGNAGDHQGDSLAGQSGASGDAGIGSTVGGGGGEAILSTRSPDDFAGLVLWLEATDTDCQVDEAGRIAHCFDKSGNLNDAVREELAHQPTFMENVFNGHGVVSFQPRVVEGGPDEPKTMFVADAESLWLGTRDFLYAFVGSCTNPTSVDYLDYGYGTVLSKQDTFPPYSGVALISNYPSIVPQAPSVPRFGFQVTTRGDFVLSQNVHLNDGIFRLHVGRRVGIELELRINGVVQGLARTTSVLDVSMLGQPVRIGGSPGSAFVGELAEILIVAGATSDDDVAALERGLMNKYGL